jgi:GT2 family glycosyltransferase
LEAQSYPHANFEVLVISDGATDGTNEFLQAFAAETALALTVIVQQNAGPAAARNHGIQRAQGDLILFIDDDVVPAPQWIAEHVRSHNQAAGEVVVMGPMHTPPAFNMKPWVRWEQAMLDRQYALTEAADGKSNARSFYTGNASVARRHLLRANGFDTTFRRSEDVELAYRLADEGIEFIYNPQAVGYHYAERSFASWLQTPYLYGRNDVICARDKGHSWILTAIGKEYHTRHSFTRWLAQLCISRKPVDDLAIALLHRAAKVGDWLGIEWVPQRAYSGIFNLRHYQGVTDELGGRRQFFNLVAQSAKSVHAT